MGVGGWGGLHGLMAAGDLLFCFLLSKRCCVGHTNTSVCEAHSLVREAHSLAKEKQFK